MELNQSMFYVIQSPFTVRIFFLIGFSVIFDNYNSSFRNCKLNLENYGRADGQSLSDWEVFDSTHIMLQRSKAFVLFISSVKTTTLNRKN